MVTTQGLVLGMVMTGLVAATLFGLIMFICCHTLRLRRQQAVLHPLDPDDVEKGGGGPAARPDGNGNDAADGARPALQVVT